LVDNFPRRREFSGIFPSAKNWVENSPPCPGHDATDNERDSKSNNDQTHWSQYYVVQCCKIRCHTVHTAQLSTHRNATTCDESKYFWHKSHLVSSHFQTHKPVAYHIIDSTTDSTDSTYRVCIQKLNILCYCLVSKMLSLKTTPNPPLGHILTSDPLQVRAVIDRSLVTLGTTHLVAYSQKCELGPLLSSPFPFYVPSSLPFNGSPRVSPSGIFFRIEGART